MEFDWISLTGLGGSPQIEGKQKGTLSVALDMGQTSFYPEVEISVLVDRRPDLLWSELEDQVRTSAMAILRAALDALESGSIEVLRERASARRVAKDEADSERWQQELEEKFK